MRDAHLQITSFNDEVSPDDFFTITRGEAQRQLGGSLPYAREANEELLALGHLGVGLGKLADERSGHAVGHEIGVGQRRARQRRPAEHLASMAAELAAPEGVPRCLAPTAPPPGPLQAAASQH